MKRDPVKFKSHLETLNIQELEILFQAQRRLLKEKYAVVVNRGNPVIAPSEDTRGNRGKSERRLALYFFPKDGRRAFLIFRNRATKKELIYMVETLRRLIRSVVLTDVLPRLLDQRKWAGADSIHFEVSTCFAMEMEFYWPELTRRKIALQETHNKINCFPCTNWIIIEDTCDKQFRTV